MILPSEKALLEVMPDAVIITDPSGAILFANHHAELLFGYTHSELLQMELENLVPQRFREFHRSLRQNFTSQTEPRHMGTGRLLSGRKRDGSEFPADISIGPFHTEERTLAIAAVRDVSLLQEATGRLEQKIKELADFKSALDEHAILAITDAQGRITYANDQFCRISQYSREELLGRDHRIINSGYHPKSFWKEVWTTLQRGKVWKGEVCNRAKDGSLYWVAATIVPFLDRAGRPFQYVAIRTEITARKTAEAEREQLIEELTLALAKVKVLSGLLPICCSCRKVRDDKGYWQALEAFVSEYSDTSFSHGLCPDCLVQQYENYGLPLPEKFRKKKSPSKAPEPKAAPDS